MTPAQYVQMVMPRLREKWDARCFCESPQFRKLVSFNFENYPFLSPLALADAEILISAFIRQRFHPDGAAVNKGMDVFQRYICPQCGAGMTTCFTEFSISMNRTYVSFDSVASQVAPVGYYLIGVSGFDVQQFSDVPDFLPAQDAIAYLDLFPNETGANITPQ
ncbi:MAG: hypothetical protein JXX14_11865 [Deltaproteobacteria bacterium]|nr:hypothetical protein [Deltaproteobacteria bacterium]